MAHPAAAAMPPRFRSLFDAAGVRATDPLRLLGPDRRAMPTVRWDAGVRSAGGRRLCIRLACKSGRMHDSRGGPCSHDAFGVRGIGRPQFSGHESLAGDLDGFLCRDPCIVVRSLGSRPVKLQQRAEIPRPFSTNSNLNLGFSGRKKALLGDDDRDRRVQGFFRHLETLLHRAW